jgi:putative flippase GtrA
MIRVAVQWMKFAAVGLSNTALSAAVYAGLIGIGAQYLAASALAFTLGALNSYVLNRRWTFESRARCAPELCRFACVQLTGLGVNLALLAALVDGAGLPRLAAQLLVFPVASLVTFALSRQWAFRVRQQARAAGSG